MFYLMPLPSCFLPSLFQCLEALEWKNLNLHFYLKEVPFLYLLLVSYHVFRWDGKLINLSLLLVTNSGRNTQEGVVEAKHIRCFHSAVFHQMTPEIHLTLLHGLFTFNCLKIMQAMFCLWVANVCVRVCAFNTLWTFKTPQTLQNVKKQSKHIK